MASIRTLKTGKFQATIRIKGQDKSKSFPTKKQARAWATDEEARIREVLSMSDSEILGLSDTDATIVKNIFTAGGVDIIALRNKEKLSEINALSKKEALALNPQQIEQLGGPELFSMADKRICYKTFREVCNVYLGDWPGKDYHNQMLRTHNWCEVFGSRIISDIDDFDVQEIVDGMLKDQRPTTVRRKVAVLSSIFKYAKARKHIRINPMNDIYCGVNDSKQRDRILSVEERAALLAACKESPWDKLHLLVLMATLTGARRSELLNLKWSDIDFQKTSALLADTKNGTSRKLKFPSIVMVELRKFQQVGQGLIFESDRKPGYPKDIRKSWATALRAAGISDQGENKFTFHGLRHSFCSALSDRGKTLPQIAHLAGHKSYATSLRYIHQDESTDQIIVDDLAVAFGL